MSVVLRSRASVARERVSASRAREEEMAREEVLSDMARERREPVSAACASEFDSSSGAVEEAIAEGAEGCWAVEGA